MSPASNLWDCIIIGGGPAGLGAAVALARLDHSALVLDSGVYRNAKSMHTHGVLGWDHRDPADLRAQTKADLGARYPSVAFRSATVSVVQRLAPGRFRVADEQANEFYGRTIVLAVGVRDVMPDLKGYADCWTKGIFHCLLCHGYEQRGAHSVGVLAFGKAASPHAAVHLVCSASRLAHTVTVYTNGDESVSVNVQQILGKPTGRISYDNRKISQVRMAHPELGGSTEVIVTLEDGDEKIEGFLTHVTDCQVNGPFVEQLGLKANSPAELFTSPPFGETSLPGVFAAGDIMTAAHFVANAALTGSTAGAGIAFGLELEDLSASS